MEPTQGVPIDSKVHRKRRKSTLAPQYQKLDAKKRIKLDKLKRQKEKRIEKMTKMINAMQMDFEKFT